MTIATETLAEIALDGKAGVLGANDAARSSFTARAGDSLVALSSDLGVLGRWPIDPQQGISPVHHPDGWVGLSEGEGREAAQAWWVRSAAQPSGQLRIEVLDGGWGDWILVDVDPPGTATGAVLQGR